MEWILMIIISVVIAAVISAVVTCAVITAVFRNTLEYVQKLSKRKEIM